MGFGFNLFGFPLLILATVGLLIYFFATKKKIALKLLAGLWAVTICIFCLGLFLENFRRPISLTKQVIFGEYRIDTTFYPGINSKWQYEHFKFTITPEDSLTFYLTRKDTIFKTYTYKLKYSSGLPDLWSVVNDTAYKLLKHPPILYRGHKKFYYVIRSDNYGNMFFRKQK